MIIKPNEQRRAWLKILREHITTLADGTRVSWVELEQKTGRSVVTGENFLPPSGSRKKLTGHSDER